VDKLRELIPEIKTRKIGSLVFSRILLRVKYRVANYEFKIDC